METEKTRREIAGILRQSSLGGDHDLQSGRPDRGRPFVGPETAEKIINAIPHIQIDMVQNWNKRYRENMLKIKSGDLMEVAAVVKGLMCRDMDRGLSTGERKMLHSAKQILISEIVLAESSSYEEVESRLNAAMS
jgi:CarD family transcriptional regulator